MLDNKFDLCAIEITISLSKIEIQKNAEKKSQFHWVNYKLSLIVDSGGHFERHSKQ